MKAAKIPAKTTKTLATILVIALALVMVAACGKKDSAPANSPATSPSGSATTTGTSPDTQSPSASGTPNGTQENPGFKGLITVVSREEGSGTRDAVRDLFAIKDADGKENVTLESVIQDSTGNMITNVSNDPNAIGYCSLASLNSAVKALSIEGVAPTAATVTDGSYKIQRPFYLATMGVPDGLAKDFIEFILSKEGQTAATKRCVPIDDAAQPYSGAAPSGKIVVGGSSSVSPVMEDLIAAYKAINPNATIELQVTDSGQGMSNAKSGTYDIGMASRELKDAEKGDGLLPIQIAIDGIAVIVNNANPTSALTIEQVRSIYNGTFENWEDLK